MPNDDGGIVNSVKAVRPFESELDRLDDFLEGCNGEKAMRLGSPRRL
jgi:hypothetical protein